MILAKMMVITNALICLYLILMMLYSMIVAETSRFTQIKFVQLKFILIKAHAC